MKVSIDVALTEVNGWLDHKKVGQTKREANKDSINVIAEAISEGFLVINEDKTITQNLKFPVGEFTSINYKARLTVGERNEKLKGVKATDMGGLMNAYLCALSGSPVNVFNNLDSEDNSVASAIVVFFM